MTRKFLVWCLVMPVVAGATTLTTTVRRAAAASVLTVPGQYPTIQGALDAASSGDTVSVSPGDYRENLDFHGKDVHLVGPGGAGATSVTAPGGTAVKIGPAAGIVGFTISGGSASFGAGMAVTGIGTIIAKNVFRNNAESGGGFGAAIGGNGASPTIEQNVFAANSCDQQSLSGVVTVVNGSSPTIVNNVFRDNQCRAINLAVPAGFGPLVVNNTIVRNPVGVRVDGRILSTSYLVRNNIVVDNGVGLQVDFGNGPTWDHNLVFGNTSNYSGVADPTGSSGNLSSDPLFDNADTDNFHLTPTSPALGAGSPNEAPATDFDGVHHPTGSIDVGAFAMSTLGRHTTFNCTIRATNGLYVSAEIDYARTLHNALRARAATVGPWEKFVCVAIGANEWAFRSRANGMYVAAEFDYPSWRYATLRARSTAIGPWEKFTVEPVTPHARQVVLRSPTTGLFISAELDNSGSVYGLLRARASRARSWETFTIAGIAK